MKHSVGKSKRRASEYKENAKGREMRPLVFTHTPLVPTAAGYGEGKIPSPGVLTSPGGVVQLEWMEGVCRMTEEEKKLSL